MGQHNVCKSSIVVISPLPREVPPTEKKHVNPPFTPLPTEHYSCTELTGDGPGSHSGISELETERLAEALHA